jgi:RecA-family ATPase
VPTTKKKTAADYYRESKGAGKAAAGPEINGEALGLATTCLTDIKAEPVVWLVPNRVPLGKLVMLAGDGGEGKTTVLLDTAAQITRGSCCFGLTYDPPPAADVLIISCEDDFGDTVVPRLLVAGADLARVRRVDGVKGRGGAALPFNLSHFQQLEEELEARPDVRLVIIDPAGAYVSGAGVDDHKDSDLRGLLGPLAELAARRRVTILIVKHFHKGATVKAVHKVGGSVGYINAVRAAFVAVPDTEDGDTKLFLPLKFNIGPKPRGLSYLGFARESV